MLEQFEKFEIANPDFIKGGFIVEEEIEGV